jgi:predicted ATP-dependent endonuclease of OLD family
MINSFVVQGLNQRVDCDLQFHNDLNILTGKNGSGKTSVLKLMWYLMSANIERAIAEIRFNTVEITLPQMYLFIEVRRQSDDTLKECCFRSRFHQEPLREKVLKRIEIREYIEELNQESISITPPSVFFSTFRRIEGGIDTESRVWRRVASGLRNTRVSPLEDAMSQLSDALSVEQHKFVASMSTIDVQQLVTARYADVSAETDKLHIALSGYIKERISEYTSSTDKPQAQRLKIAKEVIEEIQSHIVQNDDGRTELLRPFTVLSELVNQLFQYKGIRISEAITLGEATNAIASDKLSAGEKQMLSFICYNAFYQKAVLVIDEPELSLHVDWQRLLFPTLLRQGTSNQFIIATHSPFIYSRFPDKELMLDEDRGGE